MEDKKYLKTVADKIKQARTEKGLTIKKLSEISGLSIYKIRKIEIGDGDFYLKDFNKIQNILKLDIKPKKRC